MKAFDLQKAIAGHPLITRAGEKVKGFHYFENGNQEDFCCAAYVNETIETYTKDGKYSSDNTTFDLFLDTVKKTYRVNIYRNKAGVLIAGDIHLLNESRSDLSYELIKQVAFDVDE
jgi:hypothetical protein